MLGVPQLDLNRTSAMTKTNSAAILPASAISHKIYFLRNTRVMLDSDLAQLYGVSTSSLNQAVRRNLKRFPRDFMFQLTKKDTERLTSQFVISNSLNRGGRRYFPYVFTEHGVAMLSSVLHSDRAVQVNIAIMRAFSPCSRDARHSRRLAPQNRRNGEALRLQISRRFRHPSPDAGDPISAQTSDRISLQN